MVTGNKPPWTTASSDDQPYQWDQLQYQHGEGPCLEAIAANNVVLSISSAPPARTATANSATSPPTLPSLDNCPASPSNFSANSRQRFICHRVNCPEGSKKLFRTREPYTKSRPGGISASRIVDHLVRSDDGRASRVELFLRQELAPVGAELSGWEDMSVQQLADDAIFGAEFTRGVGLAHGGSGGRSLAAVVLVRPATRASARSGGGDADGAFWV
jgi:hypothetical protein